MRTVNIKLNDLMPQQSSRLASLASRASRSAKEGGAGTSSAFTLIELLVVIAITVILFTLLLHPLVESLKMTQSAQIQAAAQDAGRTTLERISRELGSAVFVYDNKSHPFTYNEASLAPNQQYDKFTNFLDLEVTKNDGTPAIEHAYNSKIDIVRARRAGAGGLTDPTDGYNPITPTSPRPGEGNSATLESNGLLFPLAPGGVISRYWIGLKHPVNYSPPPPAVGPIGGQYSNSNEGLLAAAGSDDNTYILYNAEVQPYNPTSVAENADKTTINENLFAPMLDSAGNPINKPELDDPDFFRWVSTTDVNWLSPTHANYSAAEAMMHNTRVEHWVQIAKAVITEPDIDLIALPHNADGSINYDANGPFVNVAHSGVSYDAQTGTAYPVVNTTVSFSPALVEGDIAPGTTTDYASQGIPANAIDNGGLPYIPSVYTASSQSWGFPPHIDLYPQGGLTSMVSYYTTDTLSSPIPPANGLTTAAGDLVEYYHANGAAAGVPVYDITKGITLQSANCVPMAVNVETGTINFATPAMPAPPNLASSFSYNPYNRFWSAAPGDLNNANLVCCDGNKGMIDLTNLAADANGNLATTGGTNNSPLARLGQPFGPLSVQNAVVLPGSVRVYGPDSTPGPDLGKRVLYTAVSPGTPLSYNEYRVDYLNGLIQFDVDNANQLQTTTNVPTEAAAPVQVTFDYQANLSAADSTNPIAPTNLASPLSVKVDYETRDLIDVNIGVRIYDSAINRAIIIPVSSRVQIGNANR